MSKDAKGVLAYLLLTFGVAWTLWFQFVPHLPPAGSPEFVLAARRLGLFGGWVPMAAAIVVRQWVMREGFEDAGLKLNLRQRWAFYLVAILYSWVALGVIIVMAQTFGLAHSDFQIMDAKHKMLPGPDVFVHGVWSLVGYFAATSLIGGWAAIGEEFGWRGYLQMRLFRSRPLIGALTTGIIWGVWHAPVIMLGAGLPGNRIVVFAMLCVSAILIAIITAWLRLRTGSVWPGCWLHAAFDASVLVSAIIFYKGGNPLIVSAGGILSWIPLGLFCAWIIATGGLKLPAWQPPEKPRERRFDKA
jgi:membrane protease YdiL (CAAX protease family)